MRARAAVVIAVISAAGVAACGSGSAKSTAAGASQCTTGSSVSRSATTTKYLMVLNVGPTEAMYTPSQISSQHPTSGEIMMSGQMADMGGTTTMPMGSASPSTMAGSMPSSTMPMGDTTPSTMAGSQAASDATAHLEVHICDRSSGQVVQNAQPMITVVDHSAGGMSSQVPIAVMQGVGQGVADLHYGNNVSMPIGHSYTVTVKLNTDKATFNLTRSA